MNEPSCDRARRYGLTTLLLAAILLWSLATAAEGIAAAQDLAVEGVAGSRELWDPGAEAYLLDRLNVARAEHGRDALEVDPRLRELARLKALEMAEEGYFDHVSPTYGTVFDMLSDEGIAYKWAGENIARTPSVRIAHEAFMESPDHRANILSAGYTRVGIGVVHRGSKVYVSQIFMKPR